MKIPHIIIQKGIIFHYYGSNKFVVIERIIKQNSLDWMWVESISYVICFRILWTGKVFFIVFSSSRVIFIARIYLIAILQWTEHRKYFPYPWKHKFPPSFIKFSVNWRHSWNIRAMCIFEVLSGMNYTGCEEGWNGMLMLYKKKTSLLHIRHVI